MKKYGNKAVHVSFKAKIRKNASLAGYIEADDVTRILNIAKYIVNDDPKTEKSTEPVPVIPPSPEEPGIKKRSEWSARSNAERTLWRVYL